MPDSQADRIGVWVVSPTPVLTQWARYYAKAKRAKDLPGEMAHVATGVRVTDAPALPGMEQRAVRFEGPDGSAVVSAVTVPQMPWYDLLASTQRWHQATGAIMVGGRLQQLGRLGTWDPDALWWVNSRQDPDGGLVAHIVASPHNALPRVRAFIVSMATDGSDENAPG